MSKKKISSALISVYNKTGLESILHQLHKYDVTFYSTGGTEKFIKDLGYNVIPVENLTDYPSILGGRVKTLHPKIFGGILNRQEEKKDQSELKLYEIPQIDLVIVDLYPFEETISSGVSENEIIEIAKNGSVIPGYDEAPVAQHMKGQDIFIHVDVGVGGGQAIVWTCDLTHGYISINADYRS